MDHLWFSFSRKEAGRPALRPRLRIASAVVSLALVMAAGSTVSCRGNTKATLTDLSRIEDLKARFNRDTGKPRLVLLLSPT